MRTSLTGDESVNAPGHPTKIAQAMIDSVAVDPAPRRLTLGSDAYTLMRKVLLSRVAALEAAKDIARSTDG
jgi:hypothetical protein